MLRFERAESNNEGGRFSSLQYVLGFAGLLDRSYNEVGLKLKKRVLIFDASSNLKVICKNFRFEIGQRIRFERRREKPKLR